MNLNREEALHLAQEISKTEVEHVELMIFPPFIYLDGIASSLADHIELGAQDFYFESKGAFTGEVSLDQLRSVGTEVVLIGHSERRELFHESSVFLKQKVDAAVEKGMPFIFCCGEPLNIRKSGRELDFVKTQLIESLFHLDPVHMAQAVIAYEPIWAIGTGETASAQQAEEMHAAIRSWLAEYYGSEVAGSVPVLYGGSCKPDNAKELFSCENVDGGLIGGASLVASDFIAIAQSF